MILFLIAYLLVLPLSDEKVNIRAVQVSGIRQQLESFATEEDLSESDRRQIMNILQFSDFTGTDLNGNFINYANPALDAYTPGKVTIFGYYAEWCPNCRQNLPAALRLYDKYRMKGLNIVITFMYSDQERVREYVRESEIPFPVLIGSEDREDNPEVRLETTHYVLRTLLEDYRRWGTPFYIIYVKNQPDMWFVVSGEFIESEVDAFLEKHLQTE